MATEKSKNNLIDKLKEYKRKYYLNILLKGLIFLFASLLIFFLVINSLEYAGRFQSSVRAVFFYSFILISAITTYKWVLLPLLKLFSLHKQIDNEEAARQIGKYFPDVNDKLLNTLQLQTLSEKDNSLLQASIKQKTDQLTLVPFTEAVSYKENKRYLKYLYIPFTVILLLIIFIPQFFTESTARIINYNKEYVPEAPFTFVLDQETLNAFKNEDFNLSVRLVGDVIPENVYVNAGGRKIKMKKKEGEYEYTFSKIQQNTPIEFEAAGFSSSSYEIKVNSRPDLKNFDVNLQFPKYLKRKPENLKNTGNLQVPEGTLIQWKFNTSEAEQLTLIFQDNNEKSVVQKVDNQTFNAEKEFFKSQSYSIDLLNKYSRNKDKIQYFVDVIPDKHPTISLEQFQDTTLFRYMVLGGNISDDYGLTQLSLKYRLVPAGGSQENIQFKTTNLNFDKSQTNQSYYYQWQVDTFNLKEGDKIEYFVEVWDNDAINGRKSSKSAANVFALPSKKELKENLKTESKNTENQINKTAEKAKELNEKIKDAQNKLKGNKKLDWKEEKLLEQLIDKREEINKDIEKLREQNKSNSEKRDRFSEQNKKIQEKVDKLQSLMDEILDEETKKLYEELKKMLEEKKDINEIQKALDKLDKKEDDLEKELERALELFKRLKFDMKLDENIKDLKELSKQQEELSKETEEKQSDNEKLKEDQEDLKESFKEIEKSLEEMQEMNNDLKNPEPMQDLSEDEQEVEELQQKSKDALDKNKKKEAGKNQKNAAEKMQKMSEKLEEMQEGMEMTMMQENLDHLRDIMSNLVTLSFDQEKLMKDFRSVNQSDPRFVELSQQQLKLKDDAKIVEDSLLSLANRVFQIQSFVTREVGDMKDRMDESLAALKERNQQLAIGKQQFAMTSINNLALLLDDVLQQMQQQMADAMGKPQKGKGQKSKGPSLGELQNQLNEQIEGLKKSGKSGRELSEDLARMAAEQERIRKAIQEMEEKSKGQKGGGKGESEIIKKMQETEGDLVNKKITQETIERQKDILTRLLQAEDAMREKEQDQKREAETAKQQKKEIPRAFEEYIKIKEKEIELLKTIPLKLNPYYKSEVNEYFRRLDN